MHLSGQQDLAKRAGISCVGFIPPPPPPLAKVFVFRKKGILIEIGVSWEFLFVSIFNPLIDEICPASHRQNLIRLECMCLFTQDYAVITFCPFNLKEKQTECFPKEKIYSEKSLFTPKKETLLILNAKRETRKRFEELQVHFEANLSTRESDLKNYQSISKQIYQPVRGTFFKFSQKLFRI